MLKTLTMMLSLVTASICGPGNWPLISIPCIRSHITFTFTSTRPLPNAGRGRTKVEEQRQCVRAYLLLDAERVDVAEGDVPGVEPVGVVGARLQEQRAEEEEDDQEEGRGRGGGLHSSPRLWYGATTLASTAIASPLGLISWRAGAGGRRGTSGRGQTVSAREGTGRDGRREETGICCCCCGEGWKWNRVWERI